MNVLIVVIIFIIIILLLIMIIVEYYTKNKLGTCIKNQNNIAILFKTHKWNKDIEKFVLKIYNDIVGKNIKEKKHRFRRNFE